MNKDEVGDVIELIMSFWPRPELTESEVQGWWMALSYYQLSDAKKAVETLVHIGTKRSRPTVSEIVGIIKQQSRWKEPPKQEEREVLSREDTLAKIREIKELLTQKDRR